MNYLETIPATDIIALKEILLKKQVDFSAHKNMYDKYMGISIGLSQELDRRIEMLEKDIADRDMLSTAKHESIMKQYAGTIKTYMP